MKYLEIESVSKIAGDMMQIEENVPGLYLRVETYSLKKTKKEKRSSGSRKYESFTEMISAALNLAFYGYEIYVEKNEILEINQEEAEMGVLSKLFMLGITKDYTEMSIWVKKVFAIMRECAGEDAKLLKIEKRTGPFEKCFWNECLAMYGKEHKRVVLFTAMLCNELQSPIMM